MWLLFDGQNEALSDPLPTFFCRYCKASCYSWRACQQRLETHCRLFFADTSCPQSVCGGLLAMWVNWRGWGKGLKSSRVSEGCGTVPPSCWCLRMLNSPVCHPCHLLLQLRGLLLPALLLLHLPNSWVTQDKRQWRLLGYVMKLVPVGLWLPDAGAEALSLLFGTARSSCIAHRGTCAKLFPSPALQGRWGY